mmetsp:Transcript_20681/g.39301  ORF Transcript_20681/g.39301 Transcript_20681/m.39301 type:complete len:364 (+) Transcript_20681:124-1215(+)
MGKGCGGHGGLNILPQKSWNVYNWDNREKVAADEAKFEDEQRKLKEKDVQVQRDARRNLLLQRSGLLPVQDQDNPESDKPPAAPSQHVLLFQEEENAAATKRLQEAAIAAGPNPNIDKMFQLGYGCDAKAEGKVPWYAQSGSSMLSKVESDNLPARIRREKAEALKGLSKNESHAHQPSSLVAPRHLPNKDSTPALPSRIESANTPTRKRKSKRSRSACSSDSSSSESSSSGSDSSESLSSREGRSTKGRKKKHSKKKMAKRSSSSESKHKRKVTKQGGRRKDRRNKDVEGGRMSNSSRSTSTIAQLRAERLQREVRERGRQIAVVTSNIEENASSRNIRGAHGGSSSKKYHSGYGNAPPPRS